MHRTHIIAALAGLAAWGWIGAEPAAAAFGDCASPGYMARFPEAASAADIACVEHFNFGYATPGGARHIRAISDAAAGWAVTPSLVAAAQSGAQAAVRAMARLGDFRIDDVTLLLLDDAHSFTDRRLDYFAMTDGRDRGSGECLITLYTLAAATSPAEVEITVAHEIFHCVQSATLSAAQNATYGSGGDWWVEGSAEYFSALALPGAGVEADRAGAFDAGVAAGTPLNAMRHEAAVFFFWLGQARGPAGLIPFLRGMASAGGAGAQRAAMRGAMGDREWLDFAEAYIDQAISGPGGAVPVSPTPSETRTIARPGPVRFQIQPFAILFATADYECGTWGNRQAPDDANLELSREGGGAWADWPEEIEAEEGRPNTWWVGAMHTGDSPQTVTVRVTRRAACAPCAGLREVDACLAGTWQMSGGGPVEWMKRQGLPITRASEGPRIVTFRSDGVYATEPLDLSIELRDEDFVGRGEGFATVAMGRWSADDGQMNVCQDAGGVSGTVTVTHRGVTGSAGVSVPGAGVLTMRYSCSDSSLSTTLRFGAGMPPMTTNYAKIGPDPLEGSAE